MDQEDASGNILALSIIIVLAAMVSVVIIAANTRSQLISAAITAASQHAKVMASHTEQNFTAVEILLDVLATDLRGRNLHAIREGSGREMLRTRMSGALAQIRNMSVMDADGNQLFLSSDTITGKVNVADRGYFLQLKGGLQTGSSGPYVGRNTNLPTYALARRIDDANGTMIGLAQAALRPEFFDTFCATVRPIAGMETALVSAAGVVVATCDPGNPFVMRPLAELAQFAQGAMGPAVIPLVTVTTPIEGHPLRVVVSLPGAAIASAWSGEVLSTLLSVTLIAVIAVTLIIAVARHLRRTYRMTAREVQLLEARVAERTRDLDQARSKAERANLAKSRFLAAASHDLRQPAQSIFLFLDVLAAQLRGHLALATVERILLSMGVLKELLDGILDLSRLDAGLIQSHPAATPLAPLLAALMERHEAGATAKGLRLRAVLPNGLVVSTDAALLDRVIGSLIDNAIHYTEHGTILVGCRRRGAMLRLDVIDSGQGIPADQIEAIFEEYHQVGNAARDRRQGLGIGLAIVRRLAGILGHRIEVVSTLGHGSRFSLWLSRSPA